MEDPFKTSQYSEIALPRRNGVTGEKGFLRLLCAAEADLVSTPDSKTLLFFSVALCLSGESIQTNLAGVKLRRSNADALPVIRAVITWAVIGASRMPSR